MRISYTDIEVISQISNASYFLLKWANQISALKAKYVFDFAYCGVDTVFHYEIK